MKCFLSNIFSAAIKSRFFTILFLARLSINYSLLLPEIPWLRDIVARSDGEIPQYTEILYDNFVRNMGEQMPLLLMILIMNKLHNNNAKLSRLQSKFKMTAYNTKFIEALALAEQGRSEQSLRIFEEIGSRESSDYCSLVNMGVLLMQQGRLSEATLILEKAVRIDRYQYLGYYNLFILKCQQTLKARRTPKSKQLRSCSRQNQSSNIHHTLQYLYLTLSCMYAELSESEKDPKLCTKSLSFCQQNAMAYANRAYLYELEGKYKLAENDYSSAIYYDQHNHIFHMRRAEFYWRIQKISQSNEDLKLYWSIKNQPKGTAASSPLQCKQISEQEILQFDVVLLQKSQQIENLMKKLNLANNTKQKKIGQQVISEVEKNMQIKEPIQLISEEESTSKRKQEIYVDQSSKNISQQIQKLQNQIRQQGGKLSQSLSREQLSHEQQAPNQQMLLTEQIQKTFEEIQSIKQVPGKSPRLSSSSTGSRFSQKFIKIEEVQNYNKIKLQIVSAQFFDSNNRQESKVFITYGKQKNNTDYSKTNFWRQKFEFLIEYELHQDFKSSLESEELDQHDEQTHHSKGQISLQLEMKSRSIWSSKKLIGKGSINIQHMGENKCILSNDKEKTGIVYFKLKLE